MKDDFYSSYDEVPPSQLSSGDRGIILAAESGEKQAELLDMALEVNISIRWALRQKFIDDAEADKLRALPILERFEATEQIRERLRRWSSQPPKK
ncbi:MAG: hypothetical protein OEY44_01915 [Candidatus Peregrinibacteria bacterium]|nr:hypothetical protein [Candidatus Peregrinibacteria bacterium]